MKSDFLLAITQLSAEKNLPREVVLTAVETALVSAYKKDYFSVNQNIVVKINPNSGAVEVWAEKTVVDTPSDKRQEISLEEARKINPDAQIDDTIMVEATPHNAGRIAGAMPGVRSEDPGRWASCTTRSSLPPQILHPGIFPMPQNHPAEVRQ